MGAESGQEFADALEERLVRFAVRIIKLSSALPKNQSGNHVASQLLRAGTAPAPNYGEARGAESPADFLHKIRIVLKELNESNIWLRIVRDSELVKPDLVVELAKENIELCKIFTASVSTTKRNIQNSKLAIVKRK